MLQVFSFPSLLLNNYLLIIKVQKEKNRMKAYVDINVDINWDILYFHDKFTWKKVFVHTKY